MLFHRKVGCPERVVSPIEQSRGCTIMLHQEIPFPLIGGQPPLDQLQSSPLEFAANLSLVSPVVFRPVKLRGQLPLRKRLTTIPVVFLFTAPLSLLAWIQILPYGFAYLHISTD